MIHLTKNEKNTIKNLSKNGIPRMFTHEYLDYLLTVEELAFFSDDLLKRKKLKYDPLPDYETLMTNISIQKLDKEAYDFIVNLTEVINIYKKYYPTNQEKYYSTNQEGTDNKKMSWEEFYNEFVSNNYIYDLYYKGDVYTIGSTTKRWKKHIWFMSTQHSFSNSSYINFEFNTPQELLKYATIEGKTLQSIWEDITIC